MLMSDMVTSGQEVFGQQHRPLVMQMMQACTMHNLATSLPVAFMAELRFQQVSILLHASLSHDALCCSHVLFGVMDSA